ncbi:unnamed protein product [Onchocerca ochengi]|uniref:Protein kinase domain-containing protein n=2 Tax=Onchocerca TaxID=6281 RepID=A0A182E4I6_ONCOC|nr:unnamed protein product [Onchocerca ochengi]
MLPVSPSRPSHQPSLACAYSTEKDRLKKLKELVKSNAHTYQLYKVIGEDGYGIVYESEANIGMTILGTDSVITITNVQPELRTIIETRFDGLFCFADIKDYLRCTAEKRARLSKSFHAKHPTLFPARAAINAY